MIDAKEVRLGNWLNWDSGATYPDYPAKVSVDDFNNLSEPTIVAASPIPITPEILKKCGFKRDYVWDDTWLWLNGFSINLHKGAWHWNDGIKQVELKSLHQLQNLYFCLCGEELEINL